MRTASSSPAASLSVGELSDDVHAVRRFLLYSHDGLGLGHVRRNLAIATALSEVSAEARILVLSAAAGIERLGVPPRVHVARLPGPHRADQKVLATAVELFRPDVLLVDHQPFGAGGELGPGLELVRASGGQAVLGLPDILDDERGVDLEWRRRGLFERIADAYARVLVYGQPDVHDPVRAHELPAELADITSFCGYVVAATGDGERRVGADRRPRVLATGGDGEAGFPMLDAFVAAAAGRGWNATVVAGNHCPLDRRRLLRTGARAAGVTYRKFVPELPSEFSSLDALVCMGGYNTLAEAAATGVPTICVPRTAPTRDQLLRARAFAARGVLRLVEPERLSPAILGNEIEAALLGGRTTGAPALDLGGDRRAAHHLLELASHPRSVEPDDVRPQELTEKLALAAR